VGKSHHSRARHELLKEARSDATTLVVLFHAANPGIPTFKRHIENAARQLSINVQILEVQGLAALGEAFRRMTSLRADGAYIVDDPVFASDFPAIAELAKQHRLATVMGNGGFARAGGLFAYGLSFVPLARRSAWYVDRILKGEAPGELPIEQAREARLLVNLKTANALGLTVPPSLLAHADEVID
jgi:putative tryptophan/tyrosine transport system substrate-binding protein